MDFTFLDKKQCRAVLDKAASAPWKRSKLDIALAEDVVVAYIKASGYYPESSGTYLPKPGKEPETLLEKAPVILNVCGRNGLAPGPKNRFRLFGTKFQLQYRVNQTWHAYTSDTYSDFACFLLEEAARQVPDHPSAQAALDTAQLHRRRLDAARLKTQAGQDALARGDAPQASCRARWGECVAEAYRRMLAGAPGPDKGQQTPQTWVPRLLYRLGWGDKWRFWHGDTYLQGPPLYVFGGGPPKQAVWFQDAEGEVTDGGIIGGRKASPSESVVCVELISHETAPHAARVPATVVVSLVQRLQANHKAAVKPVLFGQITCARGGGLRAHGIDRRVEGADRDGFADAAWKALLDFYRS